MNACLKLGSPPPENFASASFGPLRSIAVRQGRSPARLPSDFDRSGKSADGDFWKLFWINAFDNVIRMDEIDSARGRSVKETP
jgi:hypothetical protein